MLKSKVSKLFVRAFSVLLAASLFTACESASSAGNSGSLPKSPDHVDCFSAYGPCDDSTPASGRRDQVRLKLEKYQVEHIYDSLRADVEAFPSPEEGCLGRCKAAYLHPLNAQALSRAIRNEIGLQRAASEYENFLEVYCYFFGVSSGELMKFKEFGDIQ